MYTYRIIWCPAPIHGRYLFGKHYYISAFFLQFVTYSNFGSITLRNDELFFIFFYFSAWSDWSGGLIFIVHSILIRIEHLSSMLSKLETKKYLGQDGASNKNFKYTKRAIARRRKLYKLVSAFKKMS